ncbi:MYG1 family protein [Candidatus Neptunochlamydia vexilliferae]|nr:MYG1 family protein [Candidatus Neptunochlamydia vexilliferae]
MSDIEIRPRSLGTHDGSFHADEVTACALLLLFNKIDRDKIVRTRAEEELAACEYVCDVGGIYDAKIKRFDHHQSNYDGSFSSAGMILKHLKDEGTIDEKLYHFINRSLVMGVDAIDNGKGTPMVGHCSFSSVIANFGPARHDAESFAFTEAFFQALDFTFGHLRRLIERYHYIQECRGKIKQEMDKKETVMVFEESMPWIESFFDLGGDRHPAQFIIMPAGTQWKLRGIPPSYDKRMQVRIPMPKEWAGLIDQELKEKSGIAGAVFCHKGRFISIWETKEDAFKALDYIRGKK